MVITNFFNPMVSYGKIRDSHVIRLISENRQKSISGDIHIGYALPPNIGS